MSDSICASSIFASNSMDVIFTTQTFVASDFAQQSEQLEFIRSQRGAPLMVYQGFVYRCERVAGAKSYWLCVSYKKMKCTARLIYEGNQLLKTTMHTHETEWKRVQNSTIELKSLEDDDMGEWLKMFKGNDWSLWLVNCNNENKINFYNSIN